MNRIVITGMGAVTPLGIGTDSFWENLVSGVSGVDTISSMDISELPVKFAGEVKGFEPRNVLPKDVIKGGDRFVQFAFAAADEALSMCGFTPVPERTGIVIGTAMGGIASVADTQEALTLGTRVGPRFVPKALSNIAAAYLAIHRKLLGPCFSVSTACSSGGDAINAASMCLKLNKADAMLVVGAESILCPLMIQALSITQALSCRNDDPKTACRPFDVSRDGFVIGEGGCALMLEREEHAVKRGAKIYGEIAGCGNTNDGFHVTAPHPEATGAVECMKQAISDAGISAEMIGYVNAHGTATLKGDIAEARAIRTVFGGELPFVSSTKSATGHMMGAGGVGEVIVCAKAIQTGVIPPTLHLNEVDAECEGIDYVPNKAKKADICYAMSNAFGFGGQNSSIIVGKYTR